MAGAFSCDQPSVYPESPTRDKSLRKFEGSLTRKQGWLGRSEAQSPCLSMRRASATGIRNLHRAPTTPTAINP